MVYHYYRFHLLLVAPYVPRWLKNGVTLFEQIRKKQCCFDLGLGMVAPWCQATRPQAGRAHDPALAAGERPGSHDGQLGTAFSVTHGMLFVNLHRGLGLVLVPFRMIKFCQFMSG